MIFIEEHGSGPAVALLHGSPTSLVYFAPLVEVLKREFRVLVPHFPGYGQTPQLDGEYSLAAVETKLVDALLARNVESLAVVGFSLGAYRALSLALHGSVRVTRLVTLGGFAAFAPAHAARMQAMADQVRTLPHFQIPPARRDFAFGMLSPHHAAAHPADVARVEGWLDATTPAVLADELAASARATDLLPLLGRLDVPLLARVGELDASTPPAYSEAIVGAVPGSRIQVVPGCGHALLLEDRDQTSDAVRRWISTQAG